jgi:competence protein ComEA
VAPASSDPSNSTTTTKVNANTASVDQLQAAFEAAGVTNADRWAREVAEYRPYDADPTWAQLRQELGKYNIAPDVLEKIIAVLEV